MPDHRNKKNDISGKRAEVMRRLADGEPLPRAAEQVGVSYTTAWTWKMEGRRVLRIGPTWARKQAVALLRQGHTQSQVAQELGVPVVWVRIWRRRLGLGPAPGGRKPSRRAEGEALLRAGQDVAAVARALDVGLDCVRAWRRGLGLPPPPRRPLPPRRGPLPNPRRDQATALIRQGLRDGEIARALGVTAETVAGWRKALGLPPWHRTVPLPIAVRALLEQGITARGVARKLKVPIGEVYRVVVGLGLPRPLLGDLQHGDGFL